MQTVLWPRNLQIFYSVFQMKIECIFLKDYYLLNGFTNFFEFNKFMCLQAFKLFDSEETGRITFANLKVSSVTSQLFSRSRKFSFLDRA